MLLPDASRTPSPAGFESSHENAGRVAEVGSEILMAEVCWADRHFVGLRESLAPPAAAPLFDATLTP